VVSEVVVALRAESLEGAVALRAEVALEPSHFYLTGSFNILHTQISCENVLHCNHTYEVVMD
jgi:hypothetical protein